MKNRGWRDIVCGLLKSALDGNMKTKLMLETNLSYYQLKEYLRLCEESGLVRRDKVTKLYKTTEKGKNYLRIFDKLNEFFDPSVFSILAVNTDGTENRG